MSADFNNILLIQLGDIGDVVLTTPTIRAVKEAYPDAHVSVMVRKPYENLLTYDRNLHEVVEFARPRGTALHVIKEYVSFATRLRKARYDLVIDLRTGDRGAIFSFLTGAKVRVGRSGGANQFWHGILFNQIIRAPEIDPAAHPGADQSLRIVRKFGIETKDSCPRLQVSHNEIARVSALLAEYGLSPNKHWVTINPFSRWKYKEWDSRKWGEVIDRLWETHGIPSVLIGSPEEVVASQEIVDGREGYTFNLAGRTTLSELAALISMSSLHLGVDSAAPHIAAALNTPTITIHGPSDWRAWRTIDELHRVITPSMKCVPCNRMGCDDSGSSQCLEQLAADTVTGIVEEVIQKVLTLKQGKPHLQ